MKKLGVVITDGVGFRNFVMSDFLAEANLQFDTIIIYSGLPSSVYPAGLPLGVIVTELDVFVEGKWTWFFRKWKELAHLQQYKSFYGMKDNLRSGYPKTNSARSILVKFIYFFTHIIHTSASILFAEKLQFLSFANHKITKDYRQLLRKDQPTHIFFTHQRPPYLAPFLYAAIESKIPVSSFIFSWDNLASKGRMLGTFNHFLVWSDLMKKELLYFYPKVTGEQVSVVGTPQFEPYVMDKYKTEKHDFYSKFTLHDNKKIICFSCADASIGANDPIVIRTIGNAIRKDTIGIPCQLVVRTSPAESPERFAGIQKDFPEIIWNTPKWILTRENHAESWSQRIPSVEDIKDLRSILEYADLNINMCSTMSLDFMLFDTPVINTVFGNPENDLYDDQRFLGYDHFKKVVESESVAIAKNPTELMDQIKDALAHPSARTKERKFMIDLQISKQLNGTSARIAATLSKWND